MHVSSVARPEVRFDAAPLLGPGDPLYLAEGAGVIERFKVALRALKVLTKHKDHGIAAPVFNVAMDAEGFARIVTELASTQEGRDLLRTRPNLQAGALDLPALLCLPHGTLGHALASYYDSHGIKPFESPYPVRNDIDYLAKRYREIHDLIHVLTGYGTDPIGELELQAFMLANTGLRQCAMILLSALGRPDGLPPIWHYADRLQAAYKRGRKTKHVVHPSYERHWENTVEQVRNQLSLQPTRES